MDRDVQLPGDAVDADRGVGFAPPVDELLLVFIVDGKRGVKQTWPVALVTFWSWS